MKMLNVKDLEKHALHSADHLEHMQERALGRCAADRVRGAENSARLFALHFHSKAQLVIVRKHHLLLLSCQLRIVP